MKTTFFLVILFVVSTAISVRPQLPNEILFTGNDTVYVIRADGTGETAITSPAAGTNRARWSRDGRRIVFSKGEVCGNDHDSRIWKMNANGSNQTLLFVPKDWWISVHPVFSPNGDRIAYVSLDCYGGIGFVHIANADGSGEVAVTYMPATYRHGLDWSPVGERLVYSERATEQGTDYYRISSINTDGTDRRVLTTRAQGNNFSSAWSPDGSKIAFVSYRNGNQDIYTMNSDGSNQVRITNSNADDVDPTWSPDGTRLAFSSNRNGWFDIHVMNADGTNPIQITHNEFNSFFPHWNPSVAPYQPAFDFDGDGRSDVSVFRPSNATWYLNRTLDGIASVQFGLPTDKIVPADYNGDGKTDVAIYREGTWWIRPSPNGSPETQTFGMASDIPVPADYTGDGRDELAVYRNGEWWTLDTSNGQPSLVNFGLASDKPVPADYDGDGKTDIAIFRPADGLWSINRSTGGITVATFGNSGDTPVPGDYTGDGKADAAFFRPSDGHWYVLRSEDASYYAFPWGLATDIPSPADYDGDGKIDAAVFRDGTWYVNRSWSGAHITVFGISGDRPTPSSYIH